MTGTGTGDVLLFPASPVQRQLWFLEQIYPGQPLNNLNVELYPAAELRTEPLREALAALVNRHEALRTTFRQVDGQLMQAVAADAGEVDLSVTDLRELTGQQADERLADLRKRDGRTLFDLVGGPLLRTRLVHLPGDAQALILVVHHIVADATSVGVMGEDLAELYASAVSGNAPNLPPLRVQYVDYAAWQQKRLDLPKAIEAVNWWREQLTDLPVVRLAPGRARAAESSNSGGWYAEDWEAAFVDELRALARAHATTVFAVLLAAYAVVLSRYTGGTDLPVGTPVLGRPTAELRRVVGLFVNMLVLRVDVTGDPSFGELLARTRRTVQDALAHEDVPFERVVEAVAPARALGVTALFQVGINMVPTPPPPPVHREAFLAGGTEFSNGTAKYDLFLTFNERPDGGLQAVVEWRRGLLADDAARSLPDRLRRVLRGALTGPHSPVSTLPLLGPGEADPLAPDLAGDRAAEDAAPTVDEDGRPPRDRIEEILAGVFGSVLGQPSVDATTSFFALGGDSMASLRVVELAAEAGLDVSPSDVFLHQTVAELARVARPALGPDDDHQPPAVAGVGSDRAGDTGGYRASDFPDSGLSQDQLDRLMARLAASSGQRSAAHDQTP